MGMNLTVNRQKLIDQLNSKIAEIEAYYAAEKVKLEAIKTALTSSSGGWADWYDQIAEGLRDGSLVIDNGKLKGALTGHRNSRNAVPPKPGSTGASPYSANFTRVDQVDAQIEQLDSYYKPQDLRSFVGALQLLALSDEDEITIDGSDYNGLLSYNVGRNFRW